MESNCNHHNMIYVLRTKSDGLPLINKQCFYCGEADHKAYKLNSVPDINSIPKYSEALRDKFYKDQSDLKVKNRENDKQDWFKNHYTPYLNSVEWKERRNKVLIRDNHICQSCLKNKATEVHHLSYAHVFNEPLFELVSICNPCHKIITIIDNKK